VGSHGRILPTNSWGPLLDAINKHDTTVTTRRDTETPFHAYGQRSPETWTKPGHHRGDEQPAVAAPSWQLRPAGAQPCRQRFTVRQCGARAPSAITVVK
jgi:hypothetical protein